MTVTTLPTLPQIAFRRIIRLGSRGRDTQAVQRALARAGYGTLGGLLPVFGPAAVWNLRRFQQAAHVHVDGVYGPVTHARLAPFFDDYAFLLYTGRPPPSPAADYVQLPTTFTPTHPTAGLPGYPAIDVFAKPGAVVLCPAAGTVSRLSGHDPAEGGERGGAYGWSIYLTVPHGIYFLTHFGSRSVDQYDHPKPGDRLGTVCDARVAHMPSGLSHIHEGYHAL